MCGGGTNTVQTQSSPPAQFLDAYTTLVNAGQSLAQQPLQQYGGSLVAGFTPQQQQAFQTISNAQGMAQPYINSGASLIGNGAVDVGAAGSPYISNAMSAAYTSPSNVSQYLSPYIQDVVNATQAQFANSNQQQQASLAGNAASKGAWGGDRSGVAAAVLAGQQQLNQAPTIAGLYNSGYQTAMGQLQQQEALEAQTGLSAANLAQSGAYQTGQLSQNAGQLMAGLGTTALNDALTGASANLQAGTLQQQLAQEQLNVPYQQFLQQQGYPYQVLQWLGGLTEGLGSAAGGTGTTTSPGPSVLSQAAGLGLAGAGIYSMLSDRRAKEGIAHIGRANDGTPIYRYRYKGSPVWQIGFIAQDVEKRHPEAVEQVGSLKAVDYKAATDPSLRTKRAAGGVVDGVPDLTAGYIPAAPSFSGRSTLPKAPSADQQQGSNPISQGLAGLSLAKAVGGLGGSGASPAWLLNGGTQSIEGLNLGIDAGATDTISSISPPIDVMVEALRRGGAVRGYDDGGRVAINIGGAAASQQDSFSGFGITGDIPGLEHKNRALQYPGEGIGAAIGSFWGVPGLGMAAGKNAGLTAGDLMAGNWKGVGWDVSSNLPSGMQATGIGGIANALTGLPLHQWFGIKTGGRVPRLADGGGVTAADWQSSPYAAQITDEYSRYFGRAPDDSGAAYWANALAGGMSQDQLNANFGNSTEFQAGNPYAGTVSDDYSKYLHRSPDASGASYWENQLASGNMTAPQVQQAIQGSPEAWSSGNPFVSSSTNAKGVSVPQIDGSMFAAPLNVAPGGGLGNWFVPLEQYQPTSGVTTKPNYPSFTTPLPDSVLTALGGTPSAAPTMQASTTSQDLSTPAYMSYRSGGRIRHFDDGGDVGDDSWYLPPLGAHDTDAAPVDVQGSQGLASTRTDLAPKGDIGLGAAAQDFAPGHPSPWMAIAQAGAAMMAGRSPSALTNIGQGLAAGLKAYQEEADLDAKPMVDHSGPTVRVFYPSEKKWIDTGIPSEEHIRTQQQGDYQKGQLANQSAQIDLSRQREAREAAAQTEEQNFRQGQLALQRQNASVDQAYKRALTEQITGPDYDQIVPMAEPKIGPDGKPMLDDRGNPVMGPKLDPSGLPLATYVDTATGAQKVMPYDPTYGGKKMPGGPAGTLTPEGVQLIAEQVISGDPTGLQGLGYGSVGASNRAAVRDAVAKMAKDRGLSGADLAAINAEFFGTKAGQRTLGTRSANLELAGSEFQQMLPLALDTSAKVDRGRYPTLNSLELAVAKGTGDENVVRAMAATNSLVNIYARAINPTGVPTDADKAHARQILDLAWSKGQYAAAGDQLAQEIAAARRAPGVVRQELRSAVTGRPAETNADSSPAAASPAVPVRPDGVPATAQYSPSQRSWWWQENGQWRSMPMP